MEKYNRRINRFINLINSNKNIIILYRGNIINAEKILLLLFNKYNNNNIMIICNSKEISLNKKIITCYVDEYKFNDAEIWNISIKKCINIFQTS